jgi:hypothetical protein
MATFNDLFCNYRIAQTAIVADLGYKLVFAKTLFCGVYPTGVLSTPNGEYTFCGLDELDDMLFEIGILF